MNKLTPAAEARIKTGQYLKDLTIPAACIVVNAIEQAFNDPELLAAQGLYMKPDRAKMIELVQTVIQNTDTPTTYTIVDALLKNWESLLPSPPKTEL